MQRVFNPLSLGALATASPLGTIVCKQASIAAVTYATRRFSTTPIGSLSTPTSCRSTEIPRTHHRSQPTSRTMQPFQARYQSTQPRAWEGASEVVLNWKTSMEDKRNILETLVLLQETQAETNEPISEILRRVRKEHPAGGFGATLEEVFTTEQLLRKDNAIIKEKMRSLEEKEQALKEQQRSLVENEQLLVGANKAGTAMVTSRRTLRDRRLDREDAYARSSTSSAGEDDLVSTTFIVMVLLPVCLCIWLAICHLVIMMWCDLRDKFNVEIKAPVVKKDLKEVERVKKEKERELMKAWGL